MSLAKTLARLKRGREAFAFAHPVSPAEEVHSGRLRELAGFRNPGNLRGLFYMPEAALQARTPLLVVLHGCTQSARSYDRGAGWSRLADRHGFALLYPEQKRENNANLCFNWYQSGDTVRGSGESASIADMVEAMKSRFPIDGERVFVTGLSAGGAMASVMLAAYPELFAGGAIIAGLPSGCASNLAEAFELMAGRGFGNGAELANKVRAASPHSGPWPRVSIWQGSADRVVSPANADALVAQWTSLHGMSEAHHRLERVDGHVRRVWQGPEGKDLIEHFAVRGMDHGTPLMPGSGQGQSGEAGPHMLDVGLSSTDRIAAFFGIAPEGAVRTIQSGRAERRSTPNGGTSIRTDFAPKEHPERPVPVAGVQKTIEDALRSAGLLSAAGPDK